MNIKPITIANYFSDSIKAHDIHIPQTADEFRHNLQKYFVCGAPGSLMVMNNQDVPISKLNSISDLYRICKPKPGGREEGKVWLMPKATLVKDVTEFMKETGQYFSSAGYFQDPSNFIIADNIKEMPNPLWFSLDNQIWREYYLMTLGEFSGYSLRQRKEVA